jgi:hypothetical protein
VSPDKSAIKGTQFEIPSPLTSAYIQIHLSLLFVSSLRTVTLSPSSGDKIEFSVEDFN